MSGKITINDELIKTFYKEYKDYLVSFAIIIVSFLLVLKVIIPQLQTLVDLQKQEKNELEKLHILQNNLTFLTNLDENSLKNQVDLTTRALPEEKDFASILSAIAVSANQANVSVGDFEFQVGYLTPEKKQSKITPSLSLVLNVSGGVRGVVKFMENIYKVLPLAEVESVKSGTTLSTLTLLFYYKPFMPVNLRDDVALKPLTSSDVQLISDLENWNDTGEISDSFIPVPSIPQSSSSGQTDL